MDGSHSPGDPLSGSSRAGHAAARPRPPPGGPVEPLDVPAPEQVTALASHRPQPAGPDRPPPPRCVAPDEHRRLSDRQRVARLVEVAVVAEVHVVDGPFIDDDALRATGAGRCERVATVAPVVGAPPGGIAEDCPGSSDALELPLGRRVRTSGGFCTPGMLMAATALLEDNASPTREEVVHGLEGNLCRCTGYAPIVDAVLQAAVAGAGEQGRR